MLLQNKSITTTNSWKTLQEESSWQDRLSQPVFLKYLNKTHQGIIYEIEIKIAYTKKHVYKERKETTHVEVGKEKEYTSSSYIRKYSTVRNTRRLYCISWIKEYTSMPYIGGICVRYK